MQQNLPTNWAAIVADPAHYFEARLLVETEDGTMLEIREGGIFELRTVRELFTGDDPVPGACVAGTLVAEFLAPNQPLKFAGRLQPQVRACRNYGTTVQRSGWLPKGFFSIDTRKEGQSAGRKTVRVTAYDDMVKTEARFPNTTHAWPSDTATIVADVCRACGLTADSRNSYTGGINWGLPGSMTCREILAAVAAVEGGCWMMTDAGQLRLVGLLDYPAETNLLMTEGGDTITFGGDCILV